MSCRNIMHKSINLDQFNVHSGFLQKHYIISPNQLYLKWHKSKSNYLECLYYINQNKFNSPLLLLDNL